METNSDHKFPRRAFLRGAAGVAGATVLGAVPKGALAALGAFEISPLTVMLWDGQRFVAASRVAPDSSLTAVEMKFHGVGEASGIRSIDWLPTIESPSGPTQVSVFAWTAPPRGCGRTRLVGAVDSKEGLLLSVVAGPKSGASSVRFSLDDAGSDPKLREGDYVLAVGKVDWASFELTDAGSVAPIVSRDGEGTPATFPYVLLRIRGM